MSNLITMKYLIRPLLILVAIGHGNLTAQKLFAPLNAEWRYEGHSLYCEGNHILYRSEDEVIIEGKDCSVINGYTWHNEDEQWIFRDSLIVWEEGGKVYFYQDEFYLLYDFTAEVGDTVASYSPSSSSTIFSTTTSLASTPYYIDSIVEEEIDGQVRKRFITSYDFAIGSDTLGRCSDKVDILQHIGSTSMGLLGQECISVTMGCFGKIVCYENEDISYESGFLTCDFLTNVNQVGAQENRLKVYPNPTSGIVFIDFVSEENTLESYHLYDLNGRLMQSRKVREIDLTNLPHGVYWLEMKTDEGSVFRTRIIRD